MYFGLVQSVIDISFIRFATMKKIAFMSEGQIYKLEHYMY